MRKNAFDASMSPPELAIEVVVIVVRGRSMQMQKISAKHAGHDDHA
jgi:hypothetical protein